MTQLNLAPLLETLTIRDKFAQTRKLVCNWAQREVLTEVEAALLEQRPSRIIVLKARQLGISTLSEALLFLWALRHNTNSLVIADDRPNAETLFDKCKLYYETWPYRSAYPVKYYRRNQLTFERQGSNVWVMTAENPEAGRSRTVHCAHASEVAFWADPTATMTALAQCVPNLPGTLIVVESTANGVGNWFEETWNDAVSGENDFKPFFFPWWRHPEYIPCEGAFCLDGSCDRCQKQSAKLRPRDQEERDLLKRFKVDPAHLAWRRYAIPNRCSNSIDLFHQEFPSTAEEAFIFSGVNAFPLPSLQSVYEPLRPATGFLIRDPTSGNIKFKQDVRGPLRIYRWPSKDQQWGRYFVGADPSYGHQDSDYAAAQVINRRNREQVAVFEAKVNPYAFADELTALGRFYNDAVISVEVEGGGVGTITKLIDQYPYLWRHTLPDRDHEHRKSWSVYGWSTNWKRKAWAITNLAERIEAGEITVHDERTFKQLRGYTFYGSKAGHDPFEPAKDVADDLVMALAICNVCESSEPAPQPYETRRGVRPDGVIWPAEQQEEAAPWA